MNQLNQRDINILRCIAEHRVITIAQVAVLLGRNEGSLANRSRMLEKSGLIASMPNLAGTRQGRPQKVLLLAGEGVAALRRAGEVIGAKAARRLASKRVPDLSHQLLVNGFHVAAHEMAAQIGSLSYQFILPDSPLAAARPIDWRLHGGEVNGKAGDARTFIPDGVLCLTHEQLRKSLLFFLELDTGSESVAQVTEKVVGYQAYFRSEQYRRYQDVFGQSFRGFRLLLLAASETRLASLCSMIQQMPATGFVWLAFTDHVNEAGLGGKVWRRGGLTDPPHESILGSQSPAS